MLMSQICAEVRVLREKMNFHRARVEAGGAIKKEPTWTNEIRQACRAMVVDKRMRRTRGSLVGWQITQKGREWLENTGADRGFDRRG